MSIQKLYDEWASKYDHVENKTRDLDVLATKTTLDRYTFENVLELGCGTGKNTSWLINRANKLIGFDFSDEMLNIAKSRITSSKVIFQKADLNNEFDIEDNFADLICCNLVLEHIKNLDHIFSQSSLKVKKNGLFFICELHPMKQYQGSKAKFDHENETKYIDAYVHHTSDYLNAAKMNNFRLIQMDEWFDENNRNEIPRLISFLFTKT